MNKRFILLISLAGVMFGSTITRVEVSVVSPVKVASIIKFSARGIVQSKQNITIHSASSGFFIPNVSINSFVKKGELLGTLQNSARELQMKSLQTQDNILKDSVELQSKQIKNNQEMLQIGVISKDKMLIQQERYQLQELKLQQAKQNLGILKLYQKHSKIHALQSGYIKYIASNGQYLSYGTLIASITPKKQFVKLFVDSVYMRYIFKNQIITLITPRGKQKAIISAILPQSSNNLIEVIAQPFNSLPVGLNLKAELIMKNIKGWSLPKSAIVIKDNKTAIFIIKGGIAHIYFVHILKNMLQTVIISNHLTQNAQIVDINAYMLSNNMKVEIK